MIMRQTGYFLNNRTIGATLYSHHTRSFANPLMGSHKIFGGRRMGAVPNSTSNRNHYKVHFLLDVQA
jgi:hypothetical protein